MFSGSNKQARRFFHGIVLPRNTLTPIPQNYLARYPFVRKNSFARDGLTSKRACGRHVLDQQEYSSSCTASPPHAALSCSSGAGHHHDDCTRRPRQIQALNCFKNQNLTVCTTTK